MTAIKGVAMDKAFLQDVGNGLGIAHFGPVATMDDGTIVSAFAIGPMPIDVARAEVEQANRDG